MSNLELKMGELFCGAGGMALGALHAELKKQNLTIKIKHVWANDYDYNACRTYQNNIADKTGSRVFCMDVRDFTKDEQLDVLEPIDILSFGFPCNDYSLVGEHRGLNGLFGPLYSYGIKVIEKFRPKFFVAENVSGLEYANKGEALKKIINELGNAGNGYNLSVHLYKSEEYGIPQKRHRIIIVGIDKVTVGTEFKIPEPTTRYNHVPVYKALENISSETPNHIFIKQSKTVVERLQHIKPGQNAWTAELPEHLKLNVRKTTLSHIYKRLDPDKPSYTVTACGGGGTHVYHWSEPRAITNRERARIQTFPDEYVFFGGVESVRKQVGMAVPPKLAEIVFNSLLECLFKTEICSHLN